MGPMKRLILSLMITLAAVALVVWTHRPASSRPAADRAFTCVDPITVSVEGHPVVTTPLICVPTP